MINKSISDFLSEKEYIFWDFDGVIVDSVELKTEAFRDLYSFAGEAIQNKVVIHHEENGGVSRYVKFEHYFKNIKGEENSQHKIDEALTSYAGIVFDQLKKVTNGDLTLNIDLFSKFIELQNLI